MMNIEQRTRIIEALHTEGGCWEGEECCQVSLRSALPVIDQIIAESVRAALANTSERHGYPW